MFAKFTGKHFYRTLFFLINLYFGGTGISSEHLFSKSTKTASPVCEGFHRILETVTGCPHILEISKVLEMPLIFFLSSNREFRGFVLEMF